MAHSLNIDATVDSVAAEVDNAVMAGLRATIEPMVKLVKDANTKYAVMEGILAELPIHKSLKQQHNIAQARLAEIDGNVTVEVTEIDSSCTHVEAVRDTAGSLRGFIEKSISNESSQDAINAYLAIADFISSGSPITRLEGNREMKTLLFEYLDTIRIFKEPHLSLTIAKWYADISIPIPWERLDDLSIEWSATQTSTSCDELEDGCRLTDEKVGDSIASCELDSVIDDSGDEIVGSSDEEVPELEPWTLRLPTPDSHEDEDVPEMVETGDEDDKVEALNTAGENAVNSGETCNIAEYNIVDSRGVLNEAEKETTNDEMSCDEREEPSDQESDDDLIAYEGLQDEHGNVIEAYLDSNTREVFDIQDSGNGEEYVLIGMLVDGEFVDADE